MRRPPPTCLALALVGALVGAPGGATAASDRIIRRGTAPELTGEIQSVDDSGVTIRSELGAMRIVPWDRIRDVQGERRVLGLTEERLRLADQVWRARSRLERNDSVLAEPLFERLFEHYRGQSGETALVVSEGLLRCRLIRGMNVLAVVPALEVTRLRRAGVVTDSYSMLPDIFDEESGLCTQLPPVWEPSPLLVKLRHDLEVYDASGDATVRALARLYSDAAAIAMGETVAVDVGTPEHAGERFAALVVRAQQADTRAQAAAALTAQLATDLAPWQEAWARFAVGMVAVRSDRLGERQQGLVQLVHLPARFRRAQPYLTILALESIASTLEADGDVAGAGSVRADLDRSFPNRRPGRAVVPSA